ncbi:EF hand [Opisthorchis viverrini]|uniref:EF hand n=1 Tax=Opisthorchis viverrini TaxID=6198 RepID=A0A1S8WTW1_OPIVI|nr:EF hand [Opisthorchis viverrini]
MLRETAMNKNPRKPVPMIAGHSIEEEKIKFKSADLDQNGHLNATEFTAFEHPHNYPHMAPYEIIHTLRDFDTDNDGFISQQEYLADDKMHREAFKIELENFKRYDTNGDGRLDQEEMKHWVTPEGTRSACSVVQKLNQKQSENTRKL